MKLLDATKARAQRREAVVRREELRARMTAVWDGLVEQRAQLTRARYRFVVVTRPVDAITEAPPPQFPDDVIRLGDVTVGARHQVIHEGPGTRRLTPTEWQLLAFLLDRPGVVLSKSELAVGAWGHDSSDRRAEVEVYVSRLRRKLGSAAGMVETVRRRGYRLVLEAPASAAGRQHVGRGTAQSGGPVTDQGP